MQVLKKGGLEDPLDTLPHVCFAFAFMGEIP